jgi:hypothetical protein
MGRIPHPPLFSELRMIKDLKSFVFGTAHSKGVMGEIFGTAHSKRLTEGVGPETGVRKKASARRECWATLSDRIPFRSGQAGIFPARSRKVDRG